MNFGNRLSAMYNNYEGVKAYRQNDPNGGPPTYKFDDFSMNTIGLEARAYAEIGRKVPGKMGVFLNVELLYIRYNYKGFGLGAPRITIISRY